MVKVVAKKIVKTPVLCQIVLVDNKFDKRIVIMKDDENHPFIMPLIKKIRDIK